MLSSDSVGTDNHVVGRFFIVGTLDETEAHFLYSSQERADSPSGEFVLIIGNFSSKASDTSSIKVLSPLLSFGVPFVKGIQVHFLISGGIMGVNCTSD